MTPQAQFAVTFAVVFVYIVSGNYLYFKKVLPILRKAGQNDMPVFLPSAQSEQRRQCLKVLDARGERGALYWALRSNEWTQLVILAMIVALVARIAR